MHCGEYINIAHQRRKTYYHINRYVKIADKIHHSFKIKTIIRLGIQETPLPK